jgi:hypothetical protein
MLGAAWRVDHQFTRWGASGWEGAGVVPVPGWLGAWLAGATACLGAAGGMQGVGQGGEGYVALDACSVMAYQSGTRSERARINNSSGCVRSDLIRAGGGAGRRKQQRAGAGDARSNGL